MKEKFEYKILQFSFPYFANIEKREKTLNHWGELGWELIRVANPDIWSTRTIVFLKRKI